MREFSTPLAITIPSTGNLTDDVVTNGRDFADTVVFSRRTGDEWSDVTAAEFLDEVQAVAKGLVAAGVEVGDRVALLSKTRYEWTLLDYAIWFAGAVTVPIYETSSAEQIGWILQDSGARAIVAEGPDHLARVREARRSGDLAELQHVWSIQDNAVDVLGRLGSDISDDVLEQRRTTATPQDVATLIYTSGTTGKPKGCMLTHGNFMFELGVAVDELATSSTPRTPRPCSSCRSPTSSPASSRSVASRAGPRWATAPTSRTWSPTSASSSRRSSWPCRASSRRSSTAPRSAPPPTGGARSSTAQQTSRSPGRGRSDGKRVPVRLRAQHALFDRLVYGKLRQALGGSCAYAISGGAPLGDRLGHFYRGIGLTVLEGYGLTETTAALSANLPDATKIGTVGRPLPGTSVRVADDGELLFRGGQVFAGYWAQRGGDHRGGRPRRLVPHRRRRRGRRRGLRPHHRPQEGDPRDGRRQERRAGRPGGPPPGPCPRRPVPGRRRRTAVHRRARHHRPRDLPGLGRAARQVRPTSTTSWTTPTSSPRSRRRSTRPTRRCRRRSRSGSSPSCPASGPRRAASSRPASS